MVKNQCWIIILELILPIPIVRLNVDEAHQGVSASFPSRNVCLRNFTEREKERKRERKVPRWKMKMESTLSLSLSFYLSFSLSDWRIFEPGFINSRIHRETSRPIRDASSRNKLDKYGETMRFVFCWNCGESRG